MRSPFAAVLVVLATLVAPLAIAATWVTARVDDRDEYVATVAPLAQDPRVRALMADAAADGAVDALQRHIPVGLPTAVGEWAQDAATRVVESPDFPEFWRDANAAVHPEVMRLVEDPAARADGRVRVDISPLLARVLLQLEDRGVPVALLPDLPPVHVPVAAETDLVEVSEHYRLVETAARWLPVLWLVLVLGAVAVAVGWRGRLRTLGAALLGVAAAAVLVQLAADPLTELAAERAADREELVRLMLDTVLASLAPYARGFLWAAPVGLVLLVITLWPRRRPDSTDYGTAGWPAP